MQKYILTTLLRLSALILTGCTTTYTMTTRTGEVIETQGKPEVDATSGMTKYADAYGYHRIVSTSEIVLVRHNNIIIVQGRNNKVQQWIHYFVVFVLMLNENIQYLLLLS